MKHKKHDVVQFNEKHKWCGCIGFVTEVKPYRIMVGVQIPLQGIAYIFAQPDEIEYIGKMILVPSEEAEE